MARVIGKKLLKFFVLGLCIIFLLYRTFRFNREEKSANSFPQIFEPKVTEILNRAKNENAQRRIHVESICRRYNLGKFKSKDKSVEFKEPPTPQYEIFYYDLKHSLSWCPIYKAGSSTWLYNLALLGGYSDEEIANSKLQISQFVRNLLPALSSWEAKAVLPKSLKFIMVRHPFERLLSAYRDKLERISNHENSGPKFFYQKFGRKIVSKYRLGGNNTNTRNLLRAGQYLWTDSAEPVGVEPTFKEFVRYLIDTDLLNRADDHWIPFYLYCTPCWISYDIIGKVETMFQDQLLILYSSQLQDKIKPNWRHKTNPFNQTKQNEASEIAKIYFKQLNATDVKQLYEKYRLDFELFQYEASDYYKLATSDYN